MSVFGISYSGAKDKLVSLYDNVYNVASLINPFVFKDVGVSATINDALGTYVFQGEILSVMDYVLRETGIKKFIDTWNSNPSTSKLCVLSLENFKISDKMYLVHTSKGDYYCYRFLIDTDEKALNIDGVYYYEAYDGYFRSVFLDGITYKYLKENLVVDSYINYLGQSKAGLERHTDKIEETDWAVSEFVNSEKID